MSQHLSTAELSPIEQVKIRQRIDRLWMPYLTSAEFKIVCLIFDRTISWRVTIQEISMREFESGRRNYTRGTGLSKRSAIRGVGGLLKKGVIGREYKSGRRPRYWLNLEWDGVPCDQPQRSEHDPSRFASSSRAASGFEDFDNDPHDPLDDDLDDGLDDEE